MKTNIQIFNNDYFGAIRVTTGENDEPFFNLNDLCRILDIKNPRDCKSRLNPKGVVTTDTLTNGGVQEMIYVSESNFYKVVFQSRKEEAEYFTDWVTGEVLPAIRKHGGYLTPQKVEEALLNPDTIIQLATQLKEERAARELLETQNYHQKKQLFEAQPKVTYFDEVLQSKSTYTTNQIAKEIGMSAVGLNKCLAKLQIQYKQNGTWLLYHNLQNKGLTKTKTYTYEDTRGEIRTSMQTVWTEKGRKFIHEKIGEKVK